MCDERTWKEDQAYLGKKKLSRRQFNRFTAGASVAMMLPPVGILAVMQYHRAGEVHWAYAAVLCITFVLGAWGGSKLSLRLSESWIRLVFGGVMLYASVRMIWKAWTALKPDLLP